MVTVMGIKARQMGIDLDGMKVEVEKIMAAEPRRIAGINLTFQIPNSLRETELKSKEILKHTADTCPVRYSLHPDIKVNIDWGAW
jgi:uncharacterized OsmC-like protein